ncbi:hypothetical protein Moror_7623 [Moniliophthora roreri MCA 2997]|uniref:Uncharacterized protein n=1 Tax=Moniliophthora roreri (strain MCA 2997) TaxID=1381753 RepID=V2WHC2_MONRO|nr:hypothetical protein Moror_7623 [Moniliophthora roreri MCA 2997]
MAGAAQMKRSNTSPTVNKMEVSSVTLSIIQALYPIGEQILSAFEDLYDSLEEMGNTSSRSLGILFLHKLDKALSNNMATFVEHADESWFLAPYTELLLTIAPVCDSFEESFPSLSLPNNIFSHIPDMDKRYGWETELKLKAFEAFSFPETLNDILDTYTVSKKSSAVPKTKVSHKRSPSLATTSKSASAPIPKKPKVDNSSSEVTSQHHLKPRPKPILVKLSKTSGDTVTVQVKSESDLGKGKGKAVVSDVSDSEVIVKDIYNSTKIPACGVQGRKLTEKPKFMDQLVEYFGCAQTLQNTLNSPASIAVRGGTLAPLGTFLQCVTVLPKPINKILTLACTNCIELNCSCILDHDASTSVNLSSYASLLYQACLLSKDISVFNGLQEARSQLDNQISALSCSINLAQEALKSRVQDPRQLLQALMFLDPSFQASDSQLASLCAGFGWSSSDLLLKDPKDRGYELREVAGSIDSSFHIFIKGTDINITGKKGSEWRIDTGDCVVSKTTLEAPSAEANGSSLDASEVNIIIEKSAVVSVSLPSSLSLRDSLISMSFGPVSSLLMDESDQLSDIWSLPLK